MNLVMKGFNWSMVIYCHTEIYVLNYRSISCISFLSSLYLMIFINCSLGCSPSFSSPFTSFSFMFLGIQRLIFEKPEDGVRKIVLATNMAETSITINDVVFVVDCGKAKETSYDALNNTPCLLPSWISKAAARQVRLLIVI